MRKSSKREYEKAQKKLKSQTKRLEQIADKELHYSDTDMNYQKGL